MTRSSTMTRRVIALAAVVSLSIGVQQAVAESPTHAHRRLDVNRPRAPRGPVTRSRATVFRHRSIADVVSAPTPQRVSVGSGSHVVDIGRRVAKSVTGSRGHSAGQWIPVAGTRLQ